MVLLQKNGKGVIACGIPLSSVIMHSPRVGTAETPPSKLPAGGNGGGMITLMRTAKEYIHSLLATLGACFTHTQGQGYGLISGNCRAGSAINPPVQVIRDTFQEELHRGLDRDTWLWQ